MPCVELRAERLDQLALLLGDLDVALRDQHLAVTGLHPQQPHRAIIANSAIARARRRRDAVRRAPRAAPRGCGAPAARRPRLGPRAAARSGDARARRRAPRPTRVRRRGAAAPGGGARPREERRDLAQARAGRRPAARQRRAPRRRSARATISPASPAPSAGLGGRAGDARARPQVAAEPELGEQADPREAPGVDVLLRREHAAGDREIELGADRGALEAGARLTVTRLRGNATPLLSTAARTRSRASRAAPPPSPITEKDGRPARRSSSTWTCSATPRWIAKPWARTSIGRSQQTTGSELVDRSLGAALHVPVSISSHFFIDRGPGAASVGACPAPPTRSSGALGEQRALEHYERLGFRLLDRNYRTRAGEIDLVVARRRGRRCSPRSRRAAAAGSTRCSSLTAAKRRRMRALARAWLLDAPASGRAPQHVRIDAVAVVLDERDRLVALEQFEDVA